MTSKISIKLEDSLKNNVESVLSNYGMSINDAVMMFLKNIQQNNNINTNIKDSFNKVSNNYSEVLHNLANK